jgi:hypothetical protein
MPRLERPGSTGQALGSHRRFRDSDFPGVTLPRAECHGPQTARRIVPETVPQARACPVCTRPPSSIPSKASVSSKRRRLGSVRRVRPRRARRPASTEAMTVRARDCCTCAYPRGQTSAWRWHDSDARERYCTTSSWHDSDTRERCTGPCAGASPSHGPPLPIPARACSLSPRPHHPAFQAVGRFARARAAWAYRAISLRRDEPEARPRCRTKPPRAATRRHTTRRHS